MQKHSVGAKLMLMVVVTGKPWNWQRGRFHPLSIAWQKATIIKPKKLWGWGGILLLCLNY